MAIKLVNPLEDIKQKLEDLKAATANRSIQRDISHINKMIAEVEREVKYMNGLGSGSTGTLPGEQQKQRMFVLEHLATRPTLLAAIDNLITKAENQLENKSNNAKLQAVIHLKESYLEAVPAKPTPTKHEILHEQPRFSAAEMQEKERARRENESARFALQASKQAAAAEAAALHREKLLQEINKRDAIIDKVDNAPAQKSRDSGEQARQANIEKLRAEGYKQVDMNTNLNAAEKRAAAERTLDAIGPIAKLQGELNALVQPNNYTGQSHRDMKQQINKLLASPAYQQELPTVQQAILLQTLQRQLETVNAGKSGFSKLNEGEYSQWLKSTIKAVASHKIDYSSVLNAQKAPIKVDAAPPPKESPKAQELEPPPSLVTPPMRRR